MFNIIHYHENAIHVATDNNFSYSHNIFMLCLKIINKENNLAYRNVALIQIPLAEC